jgi:hypothetical protein
MRTRRNKRLTAESIIKTAGANRRNNLRRLVGEGKRFGTQAGLAAAIGVTESYLSQLIGHKPIRRVTETTARKFEYKLDLRSGSLDVLAEVGDV